MLSITEFKNLYYEIKSITNKDNDELKKDQLKNNFLDFFCNKFKDSSSIFIKFDWCAVSKFIQESKLNEYNDDSKVFIKGQECNTYNFIVHGDISLFEDDITINKHAKMIKTISSGTLFGQKVKQNFNQFAFAKTGLHLIQIEKKIFDKLIDDTNERKTNEKNYFLKKFFPKLRMYSDDILNSMKNYFIKEEYGKYTKIITDGDYDEFVYIIVSGNLAVVKSVEKLKNLREKLILNNELTNKRYVVLDELSKGDVFGIFSAIKHHKNNHTVLVTSEKAEVYKIMKAHCLLYFGGYFGTIPEALKGIDCIQQNNLLNKLNFIERLDFQNIKSLKFIDETIKHYETRKKKIDESEINNNLKDAWRELENLSNKISDFKINLFKNNETKEKMELLEKLKKQEKEDTNDKTKVMGFGTNRVVGKQLNKTGLSATQMKGMSTLHGICGVKKIENKEEIQNNIIDKLSSLKKDEVHKSRLMADFTGEPEKSMIKSKDPNNNLLNSKQDPEKMIETEIKINEQQNLDSKLKKPLSSLKNLI